MCTGSTARDGERCIDRLLIWSRIDYRQNDAHEFFTSVIFSFCLGFRGTMYRDVLLSRVTCMMCLLVFLLRMCTFLLSKIAMHPLSQNMPIERSALFLRSGKTCAYRASRGRVS